MPEIDLDALTWPEVQAELAAGRGVALELVLEQIAQADGSGG